MKPEHTFIYDAARPQAAEVRATLQGASTSRRVIMATKDYLGPAGTLASATLVASCCLGPVIFLLFGGTFGALSAFRVLAPYRGWFIAAALSFWGYGFHRLYLRRPVTSGATCDAACERPWRSARVLLWAALGVLGVAITYPAFAARFFG